MHDDNCSECQRLRREYFDATTQFIKLEGKLKLAELERNRVALASLTTGVENAGRQRHASREELRHHEGSAHGVTGPTALPHASSAECATRQEMAESIRKLLDSIDALADEQTRLLERLAPPAEVLNLAERIGTVARPLESLVDRYQLHVRAHGC